mmetsp:Transcript_110816/g.286500  ORF Transcript_110816/g.286500 Transcript_110816/m.286500 type:complete len:198 (-) Transcript_110816:67-660(-)
MLAPRGSTSDAISDGFGSAIGSSAQRKRRQLLEISSCGDLQTLEYKEDALRSQLVQKSGALSKGIARHLSEDQRRLTELHREHRVRTKRPVISRSLSTPPLGSSAASRGSHIEHKQDLQEMDELDVLLATLERRKFELQAGNKVQTSLAPLKAVGCAKSKSVTDFTQWFKAHGRPSGASRWEDWSSSSPEVRKRFRH